MKKKHSHSHLKHSKHSQQPATNTATSSTIATSITPSPPPPINIPTPSFNTTSSIKKIVPEGSYKIAERLAKSGQIEQAKQLCQRIIETNPNHALALHLLGTMLADARQLQEAERLVTQAIKINPHSYKFNSTLAYIYRLLNKSELADAYAKHAARRRYYIDWIKQFDTLKVENITAIQTQLVQWRNPPKISIIMPIQNANAEWLQATIESIIQQIYPHWELCVADAASTLPYIHPILKEYAKQDARIKVHFNSNSNIAAASNSALTLVTNEYTVLLDQNDVLPIHALYCIAHIISSYPQAMLVYSDEDMIDELDERMFPYFKCDWNPDLFLAHNFIAHLSMYQTKLLRQIGGFRENYTEVSAYDLTLRYIEHIDSKHIHHIPHILYHKRIQEPGTALQIVGVKPHLCAITQQAISEHLIRCNKSGQVSESYTLPGTFRVQYTLPNSLPLVSIIIPTRNRLDLLRICIGSILTKTLYKNFEIIIVDNQSDDNATLEYLHSVHSQNLAHVLQYPYPFNYSAINNFAVKYAQGELICFLNNDVEVINESWLTEMVSQAVRPEIGAVGAKLWYSNNTLQHGGVIMGFGGVADHSHKKFPRNSNGYFGRTQMLQNLSAITGACMLMRKAVFNAVGGFNTVDLVVAFNDVDLCLRIIASGLRIVWTPFAELYHYESASRGHENSPEKKARFDSEIAYMQRHWEEFLLHDPAYNPNLTLNATNFALAWPPRVQLNDLPAKVGRLFCT